MVFPFAEATNRFWGVSEPTEPVRRPNARILMRNTVGPWLTLLLTVEIRRHFVHSSTPERKTSMPRSQISMLWWASKDSSAKKNHHNNIEILRKVERGANRVSPNFYRQPSKRFILSHFSRPKITQPDLWQVYNCMGQPSRSQVLHLHSRATLGKGKKLCYQFFGGTSLPLSLHSRGPVANQWWSCCVKVVMMTNRRYACRMIARV